MLKTAVVHTDNTIDYPITFLETFSPKISESMMDHKTRRPEGPEALT